MGPHPAVAAVRKAAREELRTLEPAGLVLVACSGGADSLALAAATAFEAPRCGLAAGAVTVDHGLQDGSATRAEEVAAVLTGLGLAPVEVATVRPAGPGGPEAAARRARYAALDDAGHRLDAVAVLLAHTRDDQAETVLLGLARGSGTRSLAGMAARTGHYRRPLLQVSRATTRAACAALGLDVWDDPHNLDPAYARTRVRHRVLPELERELGPGVVEALSRTADLCRVDADALDSWAERATSQCRTDDGGLAVSGLAALPVAVRRRVLRRTALAAGCPGTDLFAVHVGAVDALVTEWHGQHGVDLPGGIRATRRGDRIRFDPNPR